MIDRTTKALLVAIALGLWLSLISSWMRPEPVQAQVGFTPEDRARLSATSQNHLAEIARDMRALAMGTCSNPRLC